MSTEVGLRTQYLNWRESLPEGCGVRPEWIVIDWWRENGLIERLPGIPHSVKSRLRAEIQLRCGLARGHFDALFIASHMIHAVSRSLARQPYFLALDTTPKQLHAFGELYGKAPTRFTFYERRKHLGRCVLLRNAAALFPWSNWAAQSMIDDYDADPERVHVIPPGVDLRKWTPVSREPRSGPTRILFVGGDFYRKGGDLLLNWADRTRSTGWHLDLVTRDLVQTANPNVTVHHNLKPNTPALLQLYHQADLFALPTLGDCYSLASIEAMAMGLPVILSRTGGTEDIVKDGETGYLIDTGNREMLSDRLERLLADQGQRRVMGSAARADVEHRYDMAGNIKRIMAIMRASIATQV